MQNLRAFVAVAETGQFRIAAQKIGVSESAVSHQIARLEAFLGVQLMVRGRKGTELTELGRAFYLRTSVGLQEIERGLRAVKHSKNNVITISAPQTLSSLWLAPNVVSFYQAHPSTELRILATDRLCDLKSEGVDFAIRRGSDVWRGYDQAFFCHEEICPVATLDLSLQVIDCGWDQAFHEFPLILNEAHQDEWERWTAKAGLQLPTETKYHRFSSYDQVQAAAVKGLGIAMARTPICLEALSDGRVHAIGHQWCKTQEYQLIWSADRRLTPPQQAFLNWLTKIKPRTGQ